MKKKTRYVVLSPDGFTIHPTDTYASKKEAERAFDTWKKQYKKQGYYSSNMGRISLDSLAYHCIIKEINTEGEIKTNLMETITKREMKQRTVFECLKLISTNQVNANAIRDLKKSDLENFILELLNKDFLKDYLNSNKK